MDIFSYLLWFASGLCVFAIVLGGVVFIRLFGPRRRRVNRPLLFIGRGK